MDLVKELSPLLAAEAAAEAPGAGVDPADLEQDVWVRLLESRPADPVPWVRWAVRAEVRRARRRARHELPFAAEPAADPETGPERRVLSEELSRALRTAVARTPGNCPRLLTALLSPSDLTYREIAGELDISQGSLGPMRSRCLGCLRRMLAAEVAAPGLRGMER
ncbi:MULTISPECIES: RNA polymerase sigma factor [Streptomyces]|uniref:RNA polymerase sigma factor n=1 Tax=Streptomyces noboritoensis TaxID=67337 RepID=A0ABV6TY04_9ACTN|nr:sigma-70 family RNA polymerase sigma factor [Streptomyces melanogenes]GGP48730.1 RNA polymerase sigma factor [Streptomyces melanogenes]